MKRLESITSRRCSGLVRLRIVWLTVTRKSEWDPLKRPLSGRSSKYSTMSSRTSFQNCRGEIQTLLSEQTTFAECLLVLGRRIPPKNFALSGNLHLGARFDYLIKDDGQYTRFSSRLQDHNRILIVGGSVSRGQTAGAAVFPFLLV